MKTEYHKIRLSQLYVLYCTFVIMFRFSLCDTKVRMVNQHSSENKMKVPHNQKLRLDGHHSYIIIGNKRDHIT